MPRKQAVKTAIAFDNLHPVPLGGDLRRHALVFHVETGEDPPTLAEGQGCIGPGHDGKGGPE